MLKDVLNRYLRLLSSTRQLRARVLISAAIFRQLPRAAPPLLARHMGVSIAQLDPLKEKVVDGHTIEHFERYRIHGRLLYKGNKF